MEPGQDTNLEQIHAEIESIYDETIKKLKEIETHKKEVIQNYIKELEQQKIDLIKQHLQALSEKK